MRDQWKCPWCRGHNDIGRGHCEWCDAPAAADRPGDRDQRQAAEVERIAALLLRPHGPLPGLISNPAIARDVVRFVLREQREQMGTVVAALVARAELAEAEIRYSKFNVDVVRAEEAARRERLVRRIEGLALIYENATGYAPMTATHMIAKALRATLRLSTDTPDVTQDAP